MAFRNESGLDRILRVVLGLGLMALGNIWFALIGLVPLLTGLTGFCPLYRALGVGTYSPPSGQLPQH